MSSNVSYYGLTKSKKTFRSIDFHGKNSMTDMGLMMTGVTPLSPVTPKLVREEIAFSDGGLDLSRIDGKLHFNAREITYTFVSIHSFGSLLTPIGGDINGDGLVNFDDADMLADYLKGRIELTEEQKRQADVNADGEINPDDLIILGNYATQASNIYRNQTITDADSNLFSWLYEYEGDNDLYDYAYKGYKFTNATVEDVQIGKAMFGDTWVQQITVKFRFDPYMQSTTGARIELATFVDYELGQRNTQTEMIIFTNNRFHMKDFSIWTKDGYNVDSKDKMGRVWNYHVNIPYSGKIGIYISQNPSMNGVPYPVESVEGTGLRFFDNDYPRQELTSHAGGRGYIAPKMDGSGHYAIDLTVTFEDAYDEFKQQPWIYIEWGVLREFVVPDQDHYIMEAYTKTASSVMYVRDEDWVNQKVPYNTHFSLPVRPINEIHIDNSDFDGLYKWRYDTTTRRL